MYLRKENMRDIIRQLLKIDTDKSNSIYLNEIALLMEEIERLKIEIKSLNDIIETNVRIKKR